MGSVQVQGVPVAVREAGSAGPGVVLLHAFPLHGAMWDAQVEALAPLARVVAPDYRGFGQTPAGPEPLTLDVLADDAAALITARGLGPAVVVGLSMGGYVALALCRRHPELVRGLVLADTRETADTEAGRAGRETSARTVLEQGMGWLAQDMVPKLLGPAAPETLQQRVRAWILGNRPEAAAAGQRAMAARPDSTATLAALTCPALMLAGAQDGLTPPAEALRMQGLVRGARAVVIPGAGHLANLENPAAFNAALVDFVRSL